MTLNCKLRFLPAGKPSPLYRKPKSQVIGFFFSLSVFLKFPGVSPQSQDSLTFTESSVKRLIKKGKAFNGDFPFF